MCLYTITGVIDWNNKDQKEGWWRIKLDPGISHYYKWLYSRAYKSWDLPMNGVHCTFISGEWEPRIIRPQDLQDYLDVIFELEYEPPILTHGRSFWMNCKSRDLDYVRKDLGLDTDKYSYHITLGTNKRN